MTNAAEKLKEIYKMGIEEGGTQMEVIWNDVSGVALNPVAVRVVRRK